MSSFITWTRGSGSPNFAARVSRAAISGYWQAKNDLSRPSSCWAVKAVLPLLCFLDMTMPGSDGTSTSPVLPVRRLTRAYYLMLLYKYLCEHHIIIQ